MNDEILRRLGGSWYALPKFPDGWETKAEFEDLKREAVCGLLGEFASADVWGWKDPRTCLTLPFWQQVLPGMKYVIGMRNPADVASSLTRRDGFSTEQGVFLWFVYLQAALKYSYGHPRLFVFYEELLEDWREKVPKLSRFIGKAKKAEEPEVQRTIGQSIDRKLRHHFASLGQRTGGDLRGSSIGFEIAQEIYISLRNGNFKNLESKIQQGIDALESEVERQKKEPEYRWLYEFHLTLQELDTLISAREPFILISWYQWGADQIIAGRTAVPFIGREGQYVGLPNDDEVAIRELETERRAGVNFIVFGSPAFWWLEYYSGFQTYLRTNYRCVLQNERLVIFDLRKGPE